MARFSVALLIGSSLLAVAVPSVAAAAVKGSGMQFLLADGSVKGIVIADRTGGDNPRLFGGIVGLPQYRETDFNFRSIGCGGNPSAGNLVFQVEESSDENGQAFFRHSLSASLNFEEIKSLWIDWGDGQACALSLNFERVSVAAGDINGDGAASMLMDATSPKLILVVEKLMNGRARVSIVVNGQDGNDELRVRGVNRSCGTAPTATHFSVKLSDVLVSSFKSKVVDMTQEQLDSLRSVRVRNFTESTTSCSSLSIIAVLIG